MTVNEPKKENKMRKFMSVMGVLNIAAILFILALAGFAQARPSPTPEIDPGMASSAIALLSCGLLILTSRRSRKK